jgi:hypothetical protein
MIRVHSYQRALNVDPESKETYLLNRNPLIMHTVEVWVLQIYSFRFFIPWVKILFQVILSLYFCTNNQIPPLIRITYFIIYK